MHSGGSADRAFLRPQVSAWPRPRWASRAGQHAPSIGSRRRQLLRLEQGPIVLGVWARPRGPGGLSAAWCRVTDGVASATTWPGMTGAAGPGRSAWPAAPWPQPAGCRLAQWAACPGGGASRAGQRAPHGGSRNRALAALAPVGQRSFPAAGRGAGCAGALPSLCPLENILAAAGRPVCGPLLSVAVLPVLREAPMPPGPFQPYGRTVP
jgi:hypothetical protein